jgi:hypothetical protein
MRPSLPTIRSNDAPLLMGHDKPDRESRQRCAAIKKANRAQADGRK